MNAPLKGRFQNKAEEVTDQSLEARIANLPEDYQQKFETLLEGQDARYEEFREDLESNRDNLVRIVTAEEMIRLSAPHPRPEKYKRSPGDLRAEAKLNAQEKVLNDENQRLERMKDIQFRERFHFVKNAERKEKEALSKTFRAKSHEIEPPGKSL